MKRTTISLVVFASLFVLGVVPNLVAGEGNGCTLSTLNGDYLMTGSGIPSEGSPPRIIVGVAVFDGEGGSSGRETWSTGGEIRRGTYEGTYTLEADCTGTVTVGGANWDLVVTKDGREGVLIRTDPGTMVTRNIKKR